MDNITLHYRVVFQNSNIAVFNFLKEDVINALKDSRIYIEGENGNSAPRLFWKTFEESLMEIFGVYFVLVEGYEIVIIKDPTLPNWGRIIENVVWCSLFFLNPGGKAVEVLKNGKKFGKVILHSFSEKEPESKSKNK